MTPTPQYLAAGSDRKYCPKHDIIFSGTCWNCEAAKKLAAPAPAPEPLKPLAAKAAVHPVATGGK